MPNPPIQANEPTGVRAPKTFQPTVKDFKRPEQQKFAVRESDKTQRIGAIEMTPSGLKRLEDYPGYSRSYHKYRGKGRAVGDIIGPLNNRDQFPQRDSTIGAITRWPPVSDEQQQAGWRKDSGFSKWLTDMLKSIEGFSAELYPDLGVDAIGHGHRILDEDPDEWSTDPNYRMSKNAGYRVMLNDLTKKKAFVKGKYNDDNNNGRSDGPDSFDSLPQKMQEALTARSFHGSGYWKNMGRAINKGNLGGTLREMALKEKAWPKFGERITTERERLPGSEYFKLRDDKGSPIRKPMPHTMSKHYFDPMDDYSERPPPIPYRNE